MSKINVVKATQLGMPSGTASAKLRKMLLFRAVQRLGEDVCFKCKKQIQKIEEFTIEHKKPWLHISADLFWDLDNIAYSHAACNRPERKSWGIPPSKKEGPEGTAWCAGHKEFLPTTQFYKDTEHWNGYRRYCIDCTRNNRSR